jgi:serine/threonine protein phosphatase PrpC
MQCPACNAEAAAGSKFCEECGSALEAMAATASGTADPKLRCTTCGAGPHAIDDDGFCTQCGDRRLLPWRHRVEDVLSAKVAGVSDIGTTYHENQDFFVLGLAESGELVSIVCDGVSHSQHSMEGSKVSCDTALASICADLKGGADEPNAILKQAMSRAQEAICQVPFVKGLTEMVGGEEELVPPAQATAVGVLVKGRRITIGWLGDSRAYWLGADGARQLTTDHSWFNDVVGSGAMTAEQALKDKRARGIVRSLGADLDGSNPGVEPDALTLNLTESGALLVVSDGFYTYADEKQITRLVKALPRDIDALTMARHLVEYARHAGGRDNITVVVILF